ncbi:hypothetical protein BH11VER1_BH11VER1_37540 [soil metagenome]
MKTSPLNLLSECYRSALQCYLQEASPISPQSAHDLGEQAVLLGVETFGLASIHHQAFDDLKLSNFPSPKHDEMAARAAIFFTEAITPIEETHRFAVETGEDLEHLNATLEKLTQALFDIKRKLQDEITDRKMAEAEFIISEVHTTQLLRESRIMEEHLQGMARKILSANEAGRKRMSHQLQDEIAQTLLGIHVRLLRLKKEAEVNNITVSEEIATIQRLVENSVKTINQLAHEFSKPHKT